MKRIVFLFFYLFTFLPLTIDAAPAWPFPFTVQQPDGTTLTIQLHGDEHFSWVTIAGDDVLLANKDNAYYIAEINEAGELVPTTLLAHDAQLRTADELTAIERQAPRQAFFLEQGTARIEQARRAMDINSNNNYFPHQGTPRVLIILADYPDKGFTVQNPKETFDEYFNGNGAVSYTANSKKNICSVAKYFETVSNGKYKPQFDVVGPVRLPQNMFYYGDGGGNPNNELLIQLCKDACDLVKDDVNFSDYDNNNDGTAELIYILHAGYGENTGGPSETMWAKCGTINISVNGITIRHGGCHSELLSGTNLNGIGPFIHEFSHGMGLPDIYSTTATAQKYINQNMQSWDVMDYGIYSGGAYAPAAYTAWEQEVFGWIEIQKLTEPTANITATPLLAEGTAYKIQNPKKENEYIVLETIQRSSLNSAARGHGLLAYHIDYYGSVVNMSDAPNNLKNHPRVAVIPSGGLQFSTTCVDTVTYTSNLWLSTHAATPFPGTKKVTTLTDEQELPNFCFYEGNTTTKTPVGHSIYNITEDTSSGIVTFSYDIIETEPVQGETTVEYKDFTEETNLENATINNIYYNLNSDNGDGYDATENCLVINTVTDMTDITSTTSSENIKSKFAGIILEVNGQGSLKINCQTQGTSALNVKIGDNEATVITQNEKGDVTIGYNVQEATSVYIYATETSSSSPEMDITVQPDANRAFSRAGVAASDNAVKIFALAVLPESTGISSVNVNANDNDNCWYTLDGRKLSQTPTQKGIYIHRGTKVVIK